MADNSKIEWTNASWNPIRARFLAIQNDGSGKERIGWHCEHVSEGCRNCYAEGINRRLGTGRDFKPGERFREDKVGYNNGEVKIFLDEQMLTQPLRWKKPRKIFVCSMTDAFADFVTDEMLDKMFAVMALCPQHTFQVLTKRAGRMRVYLSTSGVVDKIVEAIEAIGRDAAARNKPSSRRVVTADEIIAGDAHATAFNMRGGYSAWPLPNVWLGVSAERQREADERIPALLAAPAAIRFVSLEPLLGPIDLSAIERTRAGGILRPLDGRFRTLDWVIVGGESGKDARPMSILWARELRDQCFAAGVAFFFKQWGEWRPAGCCPSGTPGRYSFGDYEYDRGAMIQVDAYPREFTKFGARTVMQRIGKAAAGRVLDGVEHNGFPRVPA